MSDNSTKDEGIAVTREPGEDIEESDDATDADVVAEIERPNPYINTPEGIAGAMAYFKLDVNAIMALGNEPRALGGGGAVGVRHLNLVRGGTIPDTASTPWGIALRKLGRLGPGGPDGKHAVWCLRDKHHGAPVGSLERANTSCVLMPPTDAVGALLLCSHSSCELLKTDDWLNELETLAPGAWAAASAEAAEIATRAARAAEAAARAWESTLSRQGRNPKPSFGNLCKILRNAPEYKGKLRRNRMTQKIEFEGVSLPEERAGQIREHMEDAPWGGFSPEKGTLFDAIFTVASESSYHPVEEYFNGLTWDRTSRIDQVLTEILGTPESQASPLERTMIRKWFIATARRVRTPGIKFDDALIFTGKQGKGKSTFFAVLGGEWFGDTEIRIGDKDGLQQIHANLITEWGEFDRVTSARHAGEVKAFVSRRADDFRPPYGRNVERYKRSCVIVGTLNPKSFLNDPTGSRRFWVVRIVGEINIKLLTEWRDQLWAEADALAKTDETHYLEGEDVTLHAEAMEHHRIRDPFEGIIESWVGEKWPGIVASTKRRYLRTSDILAGALDLKPKDCTKVMEMRAGDAMGALGYESKRIRLKQGEQHLYRDASGAAKTHLHAWVPKASINTPELDAASEIVLDGDPASAPNDPGSDDLND